MASIQKKGNTFYVVYSVSSGEKTKQIWKKAESYSNARTLKTKIEYEQSQNIHVPESEWTLRSFMIEFIEKHGKKKWGTSYYNSSIKLLENYVYPYWKTLPITKVTVKAVDDYYDYLLTKCPRSYNKHNRQGTGKCVSPSVIKDIHKILRCAFNLAKRWQLISQNPFLDATLPEYRAQERAALLPKEFQKALSGSDQPNNYDMYVIHVAMNLAFACSMRGGEIGGLQWEDIDMQEGVIHINKAIDRATKQAMKYVTKGEIYFKFPNSYPGVKTSIVLKNTKTDGSNRSVYVPKSVLQKLQKLQNLQRVMQEELGDDGYLDYKLVICQANGRPMMTEHLNKRFKEVLKKIGVREVVFHSIRSTSTTYKLKLSGGDIKAVQGDNGQADPKMVTKQYSRIWDEDRRHLAQKMEKKFYGGSEPEQQNPPPDLQQLAALLQGNPELLSELLESLQGKKTF